VGPFRNLQGYRRSLVAGEEPELCVRLRQQGWKILRIDADMTLHDAALAHFGQWWRRNVRAGHACAEVSDLHRQGPIRLWIRENRSNWFWGLLLPLVALVAAPFTWGVSCLLLLGYLLLYWRVYRSRRRAGDRPADARLYARFCLLGKFPQASGQLLYYRNKLSNRPTDLIEYKGPQALPVAYLVNQYPHVSHSFIRREILALEEYGIPIARFSVRLTKAELVDPADLTEESKTRILLGAGISRLLRSLVGTALRRPWKWLRAAAQAYRLARRSHSGMLRHGAYLAEACVLARELRRCGARHLHAHFGTNSAAVAMLTHTLGGPPYSFTVHGPEEFDRPESLSLGEKIEQALFVIAVSEYGRSQLLRWCAPEHWGKVHVIRCGVDAAYLRGEPQPVSETNRLVCVGRLCEQKGQLRLLEALSRLAAEGVAFEMILAGDGPMRPAVEAAIRRLGLEGSVRITGWLSNDAIRKHLLDSRAMVLPSFAEGLPVVIMEALAVGRPVLSTYIAGIPELVENGAHGWLIPAGSVEALAAALRQVLVTPVPRLTEMGRAGAERVACLHNAAQEALRLGHLFQANEEKQR
jgi:glycosyltransferase involved in cell wall biosynthesis